MSQFDGSSTACQLSSELASGRLSASSLVDDCLDRIARHDPRLSAFIEVYADDARQAAQQADLAVRAGRRLGPLQGMPIALKDLIEMEGRITTAGSAAWKNRRSTRTATVVRRLVQQGAIIVGKTHTVEFATGSWGTNQHMGTPRNPWDRDVMRAAGGSSSGSGVAVAAGFVPLALGTDTGGSGRVPASWCGLTALRPSRGRISFAGIIPLSHSLDTVSPMARSVGDVALLYRALEGADLADRRTVGLPPQGARSASRRTGDRLVLATLPDADRARVADEVLRAYDASVEVFRAAGAHIVQPDLPHGFDEVAPLNNSIMCTEGYAVHRRMVDDPTQPLDEDVRLRLAGGRNTMACAYLELLERRRAMSARTQEAFRHIDALLTPTTATAALAVADIDQTQSSAYFTRYANFFDLTALALPNGATPGGLPTSLQIIGARYDESLVLDIGALYQSQTNWHTRRPPP